MVKDSRISSLVAEILVSKAVVMEVRTRAVRRLIHRLAKDSSLLRARPASIRKETKVDLRATWMVIVRSRSP